MTHVTTLMATKGYNSSTDHKENYSRLKEGSKDSSTYTFRAGKKYAIAGVCDTDCSDLDIRLYNSSGTLLKKDIDNDSTPIIDFEPSVTDTYRIDTKMVSCSTTSPCFFRVKVFTK